MGRKGELTKNRIIECTIKLLQKKGLDQISVREICEQAHIAKGTFYVHFAAKEDVAWAILSHNLEDILMKLERFNSLEPSIESIDTILEYIFTFSREKQEMLRLIHGVKFRDYIGLDNMYKEYGSTWGEAFEVFLQEGVNQGVFHISNVSFTAHFLSASIHELIDLVIYGSSPFTLEEIEKEIRAVILKIIL